MREVLRESSYIFPLSIYVNHKSFSIWKTKRSSPQGARTRSFSPAELDEVEGGSSLLFVRSV